MLASFVSELAEKMTPGPDCRGAKAGAGVDSRRANDRRPPQMRDHVPRRGDRLQHVGDCRDCGSAGAEETSARNKTSTTSSQSSSLRIPVPASLKPTHSVLRLAIRRVHCPAAASTARVRGPPGPRREGQRAALGDLVCRKPNDLEFIVDSYCFISGMKGDINKGVCAARIQKAVVVPPCQAVTYNGSAVINSKGVPAD